MSTIPTYPYPITSVPHAKELIATAVRFFQPVVFSTRPCASPAH